ncbi:MAG: chemotaxis protein CheW [Bryobacteraceae bacterium]|nr:chemotaxis protein CheW [Bryobacteraceae bacterium]
MGVVAQREAARAPGAGAGRQGKYLVFQLGREEFGVEVLKVREIMGLQQITEVPQTPHYVRGVINLRGKVIPVVDLRRKFGMADGEQTARTCIVVLQVRRRGGGDPLLMGVIVDGVSEVLTIHEQDVEDTPSFGEGIHLPYILGMAKVKGRVKILLDIDEVMTAQELAGLESLPLGGGEAGAEA